MTPRLLLTAALLGASLAHAQVSIFNIPALPPGKSAPAAPAPATPTAPAAGATTLPTAGAALTIPHQATLTGPATLKVGEAVTWTFNLSNQGEQPIRLEHGACDVRFEVRNAAGQVVRGNPTNTLCTLQIVTTEVGPGETMDVQAIRWDGRDSQGRALPAGEYTIRAVFSGAGVRIAAEDFSVTLEN
ncbi:BsuPI-related putative proteinase inhibitor [Deinococcus arcticus]|uniref:Intracellular proteinase inhibitor BsuPI domain-containing protein n=1 Tax=Deinococcus arcticus TaxID=2136176 RepID=A0A2T3W8Z6_9DEIO|nr:BsuPI-related putative proteinase inhibitor [Deinococcus arcticus]PTA68365.1 hypothetical protein C8263_07955 [Deinococcus arcticus]